MENRRLRVWAGVVFALVVSAGALGAQSLGFEAGRWSAGVAVEGISPSGCEGLPSGLWLEGVGRQIVNPPESLSIVSDSHGHGTMQLPAVPAAISMGLWGFLCLSLVRDRRVWIAMLGGLLWAGQCGVELVPQVGHRLCRGFSRIYNSPAGSFEPDILASLDTLTGDAQQRQFAGLLRKLDGIPDRRSSVFSDGVGMRKIAPVKVIAGRYGAREGHGLHESEVLCSVCATEHFVVFSPAFIFSNLGRGPPAV